MTLLGAVTAVLTGCAAPEARQELPLREAAVFSAAGGAPIEARWWRALGDPALEARIGRALGENFTLAAAWERLRAARAVVAIERSALSPRVDGVAIGELRDGDGVSESSFVQLGLEAAYEVDAWGRLSALVDAQELRAAATAEDYFAAAITLSAEVALTWFRLAEALRQLELIESQLETNLTVLEVLEERFGVGQAGSADVLRQRQLVEATREQRIAARSRVEVLEHQLAVLEGRAPQGGPAIETSAEPPELPVVPALPATGLPAELVVRRPDVRAALLRLEAADAEVAAAVRDQYPRIDLAAAVTTSAEDPGSLFSDWLASIAGQVVAPIIDGGLRRAEVERSVAVRRELLARYGDAVLLAFQEVEDALAQEAHQLRLIESLEEQLALSAATLEQLRTQYLNGAADFIDVLIALREQQELERDLLAARLDRVAFRVRLYRALAGGFETPLEARSTGPEPGGSRGRDS